MNFCNIALNWIHVYSTDEDFYWQISYHRRVIISIQSKIWIAVVIYLIIMWCMTLSIIMILFKLL
ncbi:MAG: hypothetical protein Q4P11_06990 [Methanobrevibacter sp.]|nr:hypothetical protein [Methanobrevibacter sp.]